MEDAFLGEVRIIAQDFPPANWALCDGSLLSIEEYKQLYSIIGNRFGGDGITTFALPNLSGHAVMSQGAGQGLTERQVGDRVGSPTVLLEQTQLPTHIHGVNAINSSGHSSAPTNNYWAVAPIQGAPPHQTIKPLYTATPNTPMAPNALTTTGGNQPHNNMQPYLAMNFIICLRGDLPL